MSEEKPRLSAQELLDRLEPALSLRRRVRAVATLVAGVAGALFVIGLWASEPGPLPGRTQLAFGLFTAFCLGWACYGGWLLTRRVPLFATDRVVAGWLALAASAVTTTLLVVVAVQRGEGLGVALGAGGPVVAVALALTIRAHVRRAALLRRRRELSGDEP
ncbi:hypothetical protein AB0K18_06960 [Nonomuraea sp. NPDC049421]|uniref:hypothetical protein n=1 Tax=Nonomuraea sp. NPDC049421 TaxID=3155275 RepID=UPI003434224A